MKQRFGQSNFMGMAKVLNTDDDKEIEISIDEWPDIFEGIQDDHLIIKMPTVSKTSADKVFGSSTNEQEEGEIILDSGCTQSISPEGIQMDQSKSGFIDLVPISHIAIKVADKRKVQVKAFGQYRLILSNGDHVTLDDVLYIPDIACTLISVSQLTTITVDAMIMFSSTHFYLWLCDNDIVIPLGEMKDLLYKFSSPKNKIFKPSLKSKLSKNTSQIKKRVYYAASQGIDSDGEDFYIGQCFMSGYNKMIPDHIYESQVPLEDVSIDWLWHNRGCHLNDYIIHTTANKQLAIGIPEFNELKKINDKAKRDNEKPLHKFQTCKLDRCIICDVGKLVKQHIGSSTRTPASRVLERLWSDWSGKIPVRSIRGYNYWMLICDDKSRKYHIYFSKTPSAGPEIMQRHITREEHLLDKKVLFLRMDNLELTTNDFKDWAVNQHIPSIELEYTCPYTPEEDGLSEIGMKIFAQAGTCLLFQANLPKQFWCTAVEHFGYVRQRFLHPHHGLTPYEVYYGGERPAIGHLRIYGCLVLTHVPSELRKKFDYPGLPGIFLGFHGDKQILVYNLVRQRLERHRHVRFHETRFPGLVRSQDRQGKLVEEFINLENDKDDFLYPKTDKDINHITDVNDNTTTDKFDTNGMFDDVRRYDSVPDDLLDNEEDGFEEYDDATSNVDDNDDNMSDAGSDMDEYSDAELDLEEPDEVPIYMRTRSRTNQMKSYTCSAIYESLYTPRSSIVSCGFVCPMNTLVAQQNYTGLIVWHNHKVNVAFNNNYFAQRRHALKQHAETVKQVYDTMIVATAAYMRLCMTAWISEPWFRNHQVMATLATDERKHVSELPPAPRNIKEAQSRPDWPRWQEALDKEYQSLIDLGVWELVDPPDDPKVNIVGSRWVFDYKFNNGYLEKYKARGVAQGYTQKEGIDYTETFSPVVKIQSVRVLIAIALLFGLEIEQMDVSTAFLYAVIHETVYVKAFPGREQFNPRTGKAYVYRLLKALYGLHQASREWFITLTSFLVEKGFSACISDPCVYYRIDHKNRKLEIVLIYVDDLMILTNNSTLMTGLKDLFKSRFEMKDMGPAKWLLGISMEKYGDGIYLGQPAYAQEILMDAGLWDMIVDGIRVPITPKPIPMSPTWEHDDNSPKLSPSEVTQFKSLVMKLSYMVQQTRPDLAYTVNTLAQFQIEPRKCDWDALIWALKYLRGTWDYGLFYRRPDQSPPLTIFAQFDEYIKLSETPLVYADASYAEEADRKSRSAFIFLFCGAAILWYSKKQPVVALSSTEAEYYALGSAIQEALWLRHLLKELSFLIEGPTTIFEDNKSTIAIALNPINHQRVKHMDVKAHFLRDHVKKGDVQIVYCPTEDMIADGLNKPQYAKQHSRFVSLYGLRSKMDLDGLSDIPANTGHYVFSGFGNVDFTGEC